MDSERDDSLAGGAAARPQLTEEDELALNLSRGRAALAAGNAGASADDLEEAIERARRLGDEVAEAEAAGLLAQAYLRLDLRDEAARLANEALQIARARHDEEAARQLYQLLLTARSSPQELEMNTAFGDGRAALTGDDHQRAAERLERALELAREVGHSVAEGASLQLLAQAYLGLGRGLEAAGLARQAEAVAARLGDEEAVARARELVARCDGPEDPLDAGLANSLRWGQEALSAGDLERGIRHLEQARDQAQAQGEPVPEASACGLLAQAFLESGRFDEASAAARRAVEIATELGHEDAAKDFRLLLAMAEAGPASHALVQDVERAAAALAAGELDEAVTRLERALTAARDQAQTSAETIVTGLLVRAYQQLGRRDEALALARSVLAGLELRGEEKAAEHFRALVEELEPRPS